MHCLFLRVVKHLWIEHGKINKDQLRLMESRAKKIKIPANMGHIPTNISTGDGFSGFTADQWKTFF